MQGAAMRDFGDQGERQERHWVIVRSGNFAIFTSRAAVDLSYKITRSRGPSVIDDPLFLQLLQEDGDVAANFSWIGGAKFFLQLGDDLAEGALSIAAFEHE